MKFFPMFRGCWEDIEMTVEQKTEIVKSLAMGMSAMKIACLEDVDTTIIEEIRNECAAEIAERKALYESN